MKKLFLLFIIFFVADMISAQTIEILSTNNKSSLRGLSVVDSKNIWVSGSNGTVGKSIDGGINWEWMKVKGFENSDFRDIEAFDRSTAIIMAIGSPAYIMRTTDGGKNWNIVYENHDPEIFLDAMEFWNDQSGIAIGDPIHNKFQIMRTFDGGKTWREIPEENKPLADNGEACFASSGTNIRKLNRSEAIFISGGITSHLFIKNEKIKLPMASGKSSTGANSIAIKNNSIMIVTGGDYNLKNGTDSICIISHDGGKSWTFPEKGPAGYRSCVEYISKQNWITCGLNGVDFSNDDGKNWSTISKQSFHVGRKAKKGKEVFLAGNDGTIGKLIFTK